MLSGMEPRKGETMGYETAKATLVRAAAMIDDGYLIEADETVRRALKQGASGMDVANILGEDRKRIMRESRVSDAR